MRKLFVAVLLLVAGTAVAVAGPKEDAMQVLDQWTKAFTDADVDGIVALYAPDALFVGTGSKTVVTETAAVHEYFEKALLTARPRTAKLDSYRALVLSDSVVVVSGLDTITGVRDGKPISANGRVTFVLAKRGSDWKIVQFHRSAMPQ